MGRSYFTDHIAANWMDERDMLRDRIAWYLRKFDDGLGNNQPEAELLLREVLAILDRGARGPQVGEAACLDCRLPYSRFPLDMLFPRAQWLEIHPDEGGLLCAGCMVKRAAAIPGATVIHAVIEIAPQHRQDCRLRSWTNDGPCTCGALRKQAVSKDSAGSLSEG